MKIRLFFFTFLGIYTGHAQIPEKNIDSGYIQKNIPLSGEPDNSDSPVAKEKPVIRLYPNPAKNKVEINIRGFDPGYVQVQLIDKQGITVKDDKRLLYSGNEIIVMMFSEKPGIYFLLLKQGDKYLRSKLVIQ